MSTESTQLKDASLKELEDSFALMALAFVHVSDKAKSSAFAQLASIRTTIMVRYGQKDAKPTEEVVEVVNRMGNVLARALPKLEAFVGDN